MGDVYLAVVRGPGGFNKLVVLKQLRRSLVQDRNFLSMFIDEARLCARMNHPNVVQTYEVGNQGDRHFIAMEYLEGQTLHDVRHRAADALPTSVALRVIADALSGIHYAHDLCDFDGTPLGVVHRDVSPHNVFITYDGQVKVVDFGIAKALDSTHETRTGVLKGKVSYMAPEQARGEQVDRRADVFSVGVMLWEVIARRRMWEGRGEVKILHDLVTGSIPALRDAAPDAPAELVRICERATAPQRDDRYPTAAAFEADLLDYVATLGAAVSARELGRAVAQLFVHERARMKTVVEEQLRRLRAADSGSVDAISILRIGVAGREHTPSLRERDATVSERRGRSNTGVVRGAKPGSIAPRGRGRSALGIAAIVLAAGAGAAAMKWGDALRRRPATTAASIAQAAPIDPGAAPSASATASIDVRVTTSPPARVLLDGVDVGASPFATSLPRDGAPHAVRAEASGFVTATRSFEADRDLALSLSLEREAPVAVAGPPRRPTYGARLPPRPTVDAPVTTTPAPRPSARPHVRPIDTNDPYK